MTHFERRSLKSGAIAHKSLKLLIESNRFLIVYYITGLYYLILILQSLNFFFKVLAIVV